MYSQNNEEQIILEQFGNTVGRFYDIGAWNGVKFSNTYALLERGWSGVLVEPEPASFLALQSNLKTFGDKARLVNTAITPAACLSPFWDSGGDAVSTLSTAHRDKWQPHLAPMRQYWIKTATMAELFDAFGPAEFISLDTEGTNWELFKALPLAMSELKLVCVEHDGKAAEMQSHAAQWGWLAIHQTAENLILSR
jgi:FkbM family methyltransferase